MTAPQSPSSESERTIDDLIEIIESAYGFDSDDGELCDCSEWNELKRRISGAAQAAPDPSLQKMQISTRNAVIEECARVADRWGDGEATMAAAEIRMLKTSPVPSTDRGDGA